MDLSVRLDRLTEELGNLGQELRQLTRLLREQQAKQQMQEP
jgi:hypothetical protein